MGLSAKSMNRHTLVIPLIAALAGCASAQSAYPSLAIRPAERASGTMQPPPVEPVLTPPTQPTLDRLSRLTADADADHRAFLGQVASTRATISAACGAASGDDSWARGEAARADWLAACCKTMVPLADLDRIYVDAGTQGEATDRVGAARDHISSLLAAEDATVAELSANLP